jgi:hypothetical protein
VRYAIPVEDLLLLLCSDAVVLVQEIQERALGLLQGSIGPGFQISQIREDALFEFLRVLDWTTERLESEGKTTDDISSRDVEQIVPQHTGDIFTGG